MKILVIHGPHLSLLGKVSSLNKSKLTLDKVNRQLKRTAGEKGIELKIFQHFEEKAVLKSVLANRNDMNGIILNLGGMGRGFYALQEMLAIIHKPVVEVVLSEFPFSKESYAESAIKDVAAKRVIEEGLRAYEEALDFFINKNNM
ncbi:MAG: type II 3-dehydroquinate dehydratase [Candidatus Marinimicrobia bacterium]|nr:type II 3-dehydroquinate dehydratase [Candidatus Neomarinimicrobiota bacterium]